MKTSLKKTGRQASILLLLVVSLLVLSTAKVQAASAVAQIGTRRFTSLNAAFNAVGNKKTIKLLRDVTLQKPINWEKNKKITVNLNRHKITTKKNGQFNISKGTVTFKNGSMKEKRTAKYGAYSILNIYKQGSVFLNNVKYSGHIDIGGYYYAKKNGSLKIQGGTFDPVYKSWLISNYGKLEIVNGTFRNQIRDNNYGIIRSFGTCTIKGGSFTSEGKGSVVFTSGELDGHRGKASISGGTFKYPSAEGNYQYGIVIHEADIKITGGSFLTPIHIQGGKVTMQGGSVTAAGPAVWVDEYYGGKVGSFSMSKGTVTATGSQNTSVGNETVSTNSGIAISGNNIKITNGTVIGGVDVETKYDVHKYPVISTYAKNTVSVSGNANIVNKGTGEKIGETKIVRK